MRVLSLALATLALVGEAFGAPHNPHPKRPHANKVVAKRSSGAKHAKRQVISDFPPKTNATFSTGERYVIMDNDWGKEF